jgi:hypothetical protein
MNSNLIEISDNEISRLFVYECTECAFHLGLDASFLEQVEELEVPCPSCGSIISTIEVTKDERN